MPGLGRARADGAVLGRAVLACVVLGVVLGLLWWRLAPAVPLFVSGGRAYPVGYQPDGFVAADGIFAALAALAGVLVAAVLLVRRPGRPLLVLAAGVIGGLAGAAVMWWIGTRVGATDVAAVAALAPDGTEVTASLRVRMPGVLLMWPAASAAAVTAVTGWEWLRGRGEADRVVTSGGPPEPSGPP